MQAEEIAIRFYSMCCTLLLHVSHIYYYKKDDAHMKHNFFMKHT